MPVTSITTTTITTTTTTTSTTTTTTLRRSISHGSLLSVSRQSWILYRLIKLAKTEIFQL